MANMAAKPRTSSGITSSSSDTTKVDEVLEVLDLSLPKSGTPTQLDTPPHEKVLTDDEDDKLTMSDGENKSVTASTDDKSKSGINYFQFAIT
jgi:hypothetical protein